MAQRGVFDDYETCYDDDGYTEYTDDDSRSGWSRYTGNPGYTRTPSRRMYAHQRGLPPLMPLHSITRGPPPILAHPPPNNFRYYDQPQPPTPLKPRAEPRRRSRSITIKRPHKTSSEKSADVWKWTTIVFACLAGAALLAAWLLNTVCIVQLPGGTLDGAPFSAEQVRVGFHATELFAFGAMPNTPWYSYSQSSAATFVQILTIVGAALAVVSALFKLWGASGRRCAGDMFGSLQCWAFNHEPPPLGGMFWKIWWLLVMSLPATLVAVCFVYIWTTTSSAARARLGASVTPGWSLIAAGCGVLCLIIACITSARHALLASRVPQEIIRSSKWEHSSEPRSDGSSTLPPYETMQNYPRQFEPRSYYTTSSAQFAPVAVAPYGLPAYN